MSHEGKRWRLRAPSAVEFAMLAAIVTLGIIGCSSKASALRNARYDPMTLFNDDDLRHHVIDACHEGNRDDVAHFQDLPACKLAEHEEALKKSGWLPPPISARSANASVSR